MGSQPISPIIPSSLTFDMEQLVQPAIVQDVRPSTAPGSVAPEVLIHWQGLPAYEDSWEAFETVQTQFPHLIL